MPLLAESKVFIRPDGPDKVTGSGRYVADITLTGMLTAKFLYAGISHARIIRLDVSAARQVPGVFAVLTHAAHWYAAAVLLGESPAMPAPESSGTDTVDPYVIFA